MGESVISEYVSIDDYSGRNSPDDIALITKNNDKKLEKDKQTLDQKQMQIDESSELYQSNNLIQQIKNPNIDNICQQTQKTHNEFLALQQMKEKELLNPVKLNVMVCGEAGLGKSTFIDAFLSKKFQVQQTIRPSTKQITEHTGVRIERNCNFQLTMIDTPGYKHDTDYYKWLDDLLKFIKNKFDEQNIIEDKQMKNKASLSDIKNDFTDKKIHVCLYFMVGPRIKQIDLKIMKKLQKYVNIIPILAKGDCMTADEIKTIKQNLICDSQSNQLEWFDCEKALQHSPKMLCRIKDGPFSQAPPFVIISSIDKIEISPNIYVFGRKYRWGLCNIENPDHSDFLLLYQLLIGYFSLELINLTQYLYRNYMQRRKEIKRREKIMIKEQQKQSIIAVSLITIGFSISAFLVSRFKPSITN